MRVLYIEDNERSVRTVHRVTTYLGYELLVAATGREGVALLRQNPDVILADLMLPDCEDLTLISQIREQLPTVPIVVVTGYAMAGEEEKCLKAGATEYLSKPYELSVLIEILKRYAPS